MWKGLELVLRGSWDDVGVVFVVTFAIDWVNRLDSEVCQVCGVELCRLGEKQGSRAAGDGQFKDLE